MSTTASRSSDGIAAPHNAPGAGSDADDGRVRHRLHQQLHRRDGPPAHLRGVRADHDRVHPRAGPRAQRAGPRVRGVRPLVLRGPVADVAQPVVLDRGHVVGVRVERADEQVHQEQQRRDDLQPARRPRQDVEGLRQRAAGALLARDDPLPAAQGSVRDALRAVLAVRGRCREGRAARLLVHRAEHDHRPQRLPPRVRSVFRSRRGLARRRPAVVDPRWRGVPLPDLRRLPGDAGHDGLQRLEHDAAHRLGRAGRHL